MSRMTFCREWYVRWGGDNNMLYPKEDQQNKILLLACNNCDHQQEAVDMCVYRNLIKHSVHEKTTVVHDVSSDPTLPRTRGTRCAKCGNREAVFFQAPGGRDEGMTLFFVCCNPNCGNRWTE